MTEKPVEHLLKQKSNNLMLSIKFVFVFNIGMQRKVSRMVHFVFAPHTDQTKFITGRRAPLKRTKTLVVEDASASFTSPHRVFHKSEAVSVKGMDKHSRTRLEVIRKALSRGVIVIRGDFTSSKQKRIALSQAKRVYDLTKEIAQGDPGIDTIRDHVRACADYTKLRHEIIRNNIKSSLKRGAVEVRYGSAHASLVDELALDAISITVFAKKVPQTWFGRVVHEVVQGREPNFHDYYRAVVSFISENSSAFSKAVVGKPVHQFLDSDLIFYRQVENILINAVSEDQLIIINHTKDPFSLFGFAGVPDPRTVGKRAFRSLMTQAIRKAGKN